VTESIVKLEHKMKVSKDLHTVVQTMKVMAATNIRQYEKSILSLDEYSLGVELGLGLCLRKISNTTSIVSDKVFLRDKEERKVCIILFGSDQGLVGQFNKSIGDYGIETLKELGGKQVIWGVGKILCHYLIDAGVHLKDTFALPNSVKQIEALVSQILIEIVNQKMNHEYDELFLIFNKKTSEINNEQMKLRLLPLDYFWQIELEKREWPENTLPEVLDTNIKMLKKLIKEYLFISIYRACAHSLTSENSSRLSSMQRADKNINELLDHLNEVYQRVRQSSIDEELFDIISGFEALSKKPAH